MDWSLVLYDSHVPVFVAAFTAVRCLIGWPLVTRVFGFPHDKYSSASASSSVACFVHGGPVTLASLYLLLTSPISLKLLSTPLSDFPEQWQWQARTTVEFCASYMIYDFVFILINGIHYGTSDEPFFVSFLLHHVACLLYMASVEIFASGHLSLFILILFGEGTNPLQNVLNMAKSGAENGQTFWISVDRAVEPPFALLFCIVRLVLGPPIIMYFFYHFSIDENFTNDRLPITVGLLWSSLALAVVHGSIPFAKEKLKSLTGRSKDPKKEHSN